MIFSSSLRQMLFCFSCLLWLQVAGWAVGAEPVVPAIDAPLPSLRQLISNDAIAAVWARPVSLIRHTEFNVLGDIPFLGLLPVPLSEMEEVAFWVNVASGSREPKPGFAIRFRHDAQPATYLQWLAPKGIRIPDRSMLSFRHGDEGGWEIVQIDSRTILLLTNADSAIDLLTAARGDSAVSELPQRLRSLPENVNFAGSMNVGRLRFLGDLLVLQPEKDSLQELFLAIPPELSHIHLTAAFARESNHFEVEFTKRSDVVDQQGLEAWLPKANQTIANLIRWGAGKMKSRLIASEGDRVADLEKLILEQVGQFQQVPGTPQKWHHPKSHSISRVMKGVTLVLEPFVMLARSAARETMRRNQFKQLLLGWHQCLDKEGALPANIGNSQGEAVLSWRVRLLPYLGQEELYARFHLDESWNSPHNLALLEEMPAVYRDVLDKSGKPLTHVRAWSGPDSVFGEGAQLSDVTDGISNTLVLIETREPLPWTQPEDFNPPAEKISSQLLAGVEGKFLMGFLDGHIEQRALTNDLLWRQLADYDDGSVINLEAPEQTSVDAVSRRALQACLEELNAVSVGDRAALRPLLEELYWQAGQLATAAIQPAITGVTLSPAEDNQLKRGLKSIREGVARFFSSPDPYVRRWSIEVYQHAHGPEEENISPLNGMAQDENPDLQAQIQDLLSAHSQRVHSDPLSEVMLAWHNHYDAHQHFPGNIVSAEGAPLLSWRVRILPLLGEQDLYGKFHLDEPWDSPHNRELMASLPDVYATADRAAEDWTTHLQAVTGRGTVFTDGVGIREITDGMSNTLALVEAADGVIWTKPEDFSIPVEKIASHLWRRAIGFPSVAMMDGSRRSFPDPVSDVEFRRMATYAGGELSLGQQRTQLLDRFKVELGSETPQAALKTAREILELEDQIFGEANETTLGTIAWLADNSARLGDPSGSRHFLEMRSQRMMKAFGPEDQRAVEAQLDLVVLDQQRAMTPAQQEAQAQAETLRTQLVEALKEKDLPQAQEIAARRLSLFETAHGLESPQMLGGLNDCWEVSVQAQDMEQAIGYAERAVALSRQLLKNQHPRTVQSVAKLGLLLNSAGQQQRGLDLLSGSFEAILKSAEPVTALTVCEVLGDHALRQGKFREGRRYYAEAVFLCDRNQGAHQAILHCRKLGEQLVESRQFDLALAALFEAVWRADRTDVPLQFRENYRVLALAFSRMGITHQELGLRQVYLQLIEQAIPGGQVRLFEQASALLGLADNYVQIGDFINAERYYSLLLSVLRQANPENAPPLQGLLGMADVEQFRGRADREEALLKNALDVLKNSPGTNENLRRRCHRRMAEFHRRQGRLTEAMAGYHDLASLHSDLHSDEALKDRIQLAQLISQTGDRKAGISQAKEVEAELAGTKGQQVDHLTLHDLADLLLLCDDKEGAIRWSEQARTLCQRRFGPGNRRDAESLLKAAIVLLQCGEQKRAAEQAREAMKVSREILNVSMYILSSRQQVELREHLRGSLDLLITIESAENDSSRELFDTIYQWKGDSQLRQRNLQDLMKHAEVKTFQEQISLISNRLMRVNPHRTPVPGSELLESTAEAEAQARMFSDLKESLEQQLSASQLAYLDQMPRQTLEQFIETLPADAVFIDYFVYRNVTSKGSGVPDHLLATVVQREGKIRTVPLGPLNDIQKEIENWRRTFGRGETGMEAGKRLRTLLWEPVAGQLGEAKLVLISPDASLGLLPFNALPGQRPGTFLIQDVRLATVSVPQLTGKMLEPLKGETRADSMLLMGGIDYNAGPQSETSPQTAGDALMQSIRGGATFQALPGTEEEVRAINQLRIRGGGNKQEAVELLTRQQATESAFRKQAPGFQILHIATHGFFAPSHGTSPVEQGEQIGAHPSSTAKTIENYHPGLMSGLALAGANAPDTESEEDGILTADEIAALPLSGVDLAVLSACETGMGKVTHGDGLIGVQRAFQIAGARSTISSLWKVNDHATQVLMTRFYQNLWKGSQSRLDALREAQIWMLEHPQEVWKSAATAARGIDRVPSSMEEQVQAGQLSPEFWGAFILSGNWN